MSFKCTDAFLEVFRGLYPNAVMGDEHESWTLFTLSEDIFSTQDITEAVEFLTVLYGLGVEIDEGDCTDLVWEAMNFSTEACQGRFRKLSIFFTVSRVSRLRSSYLTSLTLSGNSEARICADSTSSIRSPHAVARSEQWSLYWHHSATRPDHRELEIIIGPGPELDNLPEHRPRITDQN